MQIKLVFTFFIAAIIFAACKKDDVIGADKYVTLSYGQTFCADPWVNGTDSITLKNVSGYIDSAGLYIAGLSIKQVTAGGIVCNACFCKTGKVIYISTFDTDSLRAQYGRLGFK